MRFDIKARESMRDQFIIIEDARETICKIVEGNCKLCPLNREDKCGDIKNLGIFNIDFMELMPLEEHSTDESEDCWREVHDLKNNCAYICRDSWCSKVKDYCKIEQGEVDCCGAYEEY